MIEKSDLILLLTQLQAEGVEVKEQLNRVVGSGGVDRGVIQFINAHRQLDVLQFYEKLRKSYNNKRSDLYINIMKSDETELKNTVVVVSSLLNQIMIFSEKVEEKQLFLKHARADELLKALLYYVVKYDIGPCVKILQLVKADLKVLQSKEETR